MTNRYYILPIPNTYSQLWAIVVEDESTVRKNLLGTKMIVKLYKGDLENHPILNGFTELNHSEALVLMDTPEWTAPIQTIY